VALLRGIFTVKFSIILDPMAAYKKYTGPAGCRINSLWSKGGEMALCICAEEAFFLFSRNSAFGTL
jgi:hypothetical protein